MPTDDTGEQWSEVTDHERACLSEVSGDRLMADTRHIAQWIRLSGSPEEAQAFEYVRRQLEAAGLEPQLLSHEALISLPGPASLEVHAPCHAAGTIDCITHSFAAATGPGGVAADLVYVGAGRAADYDGLDVQGRVVLISGLAGPETTREAGRRQAAAQIHINDDQLHEMILSPVWGSPAVADYPCLPKTPAVSVRAAEGQRLRELLAEGQVRVKLVTEVDTGWRAIPLLVADLPAAGPSQRYVLLSGHLDSWHHGAMDNGSANATMLEVMRVLASHRDGLRRGVRVAFWSGHSHGRYAGSAWYADHHWLDLERNCVAHVNVDSTGAIGASILTEPNVMAEASDLAASCVNALLPAEEFVGSRFGRAGDQSFWGHGIPALYMSLSQQPSRGGTTADSFAAIIGGGGGRSGGLGWWWHTVHDTIDKIDPDNLVRDTRIYLLTMLRLCGSAVLPFDYRRTAQELRDALRGLERLAGGQDLGLGDLLAEVDALQVEMERASLALARLSWQVESGARAIRSGAGNSWGGGALERAERLVMRLGRLLIPVNYLAGGRYAQDPALPTSILPALTGRVRELAAQEPDSDLHRAAKVGLARESNRLAHALAEARLAVVDWLDGHHA